ncbi:hypothetical protein C8F04DRAFT_1392910 [Mycena alexandri]|uniref:F-box domain-containing protein n=1 Tax=Mycena alexandri TaxID=1745969 RepID=A0AAD6T3F0_9AGAR|nr:hypothetical protein C8F04DRAFT_1392910 [Mycena alexandri]
MKLPPGPTRELTVKTDLFSFVLSQWDSPHVLTPEEKEEIRVDASRYLAIVRQIENVQRDIHPQPLPAETQARLTFARQSYMLRNFRLFRINDLPTEIICDILRLVIWDSMKRPVDARLCVTWACKRWRQISLSDSTLWNAIWFRGAGPKADRAWAWFERARHSPLDIRIDGPQDSSDESAVVDLSKEPSVTAVDMRQMFLRLLTKLCNLRMLIVVVDDWQSALVILDLLKTHGPSGVPLLQRFELHRGGLRNEDRRTLRWPGVVAQPFLGGGVAPSLEYLSLNGVPIDWSRSVLENLTTFDIRRLPAIYSPDAARFREILFNCPRLQKLSMDGAGPIFENPSGKQPAIYLPHLRTLVIADFSLNYAMFLFSQFRAPNVNDLTLMNLCGTSYVPLFLQITASFPKVRLLSAYSIQFESSPLGCEAMTGWLDSMPLLAYLRVANVANEFFGLFLRAPGSDKDPVAPKLATIDIQSIEPRIFVQWAKDRRKAGAPLHKMYISEELGGRLELKHIRVLTSICILAKLPGGATTPEEEALSLFP